MKNKILIFGIKKTIMNSMLPNYNVILLNPPRNIIINSFPFKFSLEVLLMAFTKIYKQLRKKSTVKRTLIISALISEQFS
jgi:hypothetical protein